MRTQAIRPHHAVWLLLALAALAVGFFMAMVKPAAQAPDTQAKEITGSQSVPAQPPDSNIPAPGRN